MTDLLTPTDRGLYCPAGEFYIDPWASVSRAVITHAHGDHARFGSSSYLTSETGKHVLADRLGPEAVLHTLPYGERTTIGDVQVSLHPAGHVLGSSQVRIERRGEVCVASGDYKTAPDPTCAPIEPIRCHTFLTESTFGLPLYRWPAADTVFADLNAWWRANQALGRTSLVFAYSLGKAQRVLSGIDPTIGPILVHGAVDRMNRAYEVSGVKLPATQWANDAAAKATRGRALVVAPPSTAGTRWIAKFGPTATASASGWMQIRGLRRRRAIDRGFVLSDHADWPGLLATIEATGASSVWVTHGYTAAVSRYLRERGLETREIATRFVGERDEEASSSEERDLNHGDTEARREGEEI
jgi:putative mRNA 3-end processing factor